MNLVANLETNFLSLAASIENVGALATVSGTMLFPAKLYDSDLLVLSPPADQNNVQYNQPCKKDTLPKAP